ncbi:MAG: Beta-lactamase [Marinimicrobia bacterium 46_47]|nr:MAG: Beta-lactamase [Marinimicrobia bacterium 46_47]KUK92683.1 MAG: Beta-lactamase [Marinimicrobia bacterium 46_43]HBY18906.1 serine hydrolase [Candidatus Neomarinimicrobiota bacterium]
MIYKTHVIRLFLSLLLIPLFVFGANENIFKEVDTIIEAAISDSAWPGAVLVVGDKDGIQYHKSYGFHTYQKKEKTKPDDIFDLASITKVMATTPAVMDLYEKREISLEDPIVKYIPEFKGSNETATLMKELVSIRHLLTHTSGLPAYKSFNYSEETPGSIMASILSTDLDTLPGTRYVYSCLGFITLGEMVKRVSGLPLNEYVKKNIYSPLGMDHTTYLPPSDWMDRIVPTEYSEQEEGFIRGRVHDGIAAGLAGISGNAGLFSTGEDMAIYAQMFLNKGTYKDIDIFKPETVELFTQRVYMLPDNSRCLGWDSPQGESSAGVYAGHNSFGHTGFTGTSMWIDPDNDIFVILLTNAVHPHRRYKYPNYFDWRQLVHSKVYEALDLTKENPECVWKERWEDPKIRNQYQEKTFWQKLFNR